LFSIVIPAEKSQQEIARGGGGYGKDLIVALIENGFIRFLAKS
jgi:hypothetical protein